MKPNLAYHNNRFPQRVNEILINFKTKKIIIYLLHKGVNTC